METVCEGGSVLIQHGNVLKNYQSQNSRAIFHSPIHGEGLKWNFNRYETTTAIKEILRCNSMPWKQTSISPTFFGSITNWIILSFYATVRHKKLTLRTKETLHSSFLFLFTLSHLVHRIKKMKVLCVLVFVSWLPLSA